jgi:hypothetical protein
MMTARRLPIFIAMDAVAASLGHTSEGGAMRGFHCVDPSHDRIEFTGADDEELFRNIKAHTTKAHPQLTDTQIREMIAGAAWWKEVATAGVNAGSSPSAYDR